MVRYTAAGALDTSFDGDGIVTTSVTGPQRGFLGSNDYGEAVALQPDGKIVVVGYSTHNLVVARYTATGELDGHYVRGTSTRREGTTFGRDGLVIPFIDRNQYGIASYDFGRAVALQGDGKILAVGDSDGRFLVVRYTEWGSQDPSFGVNGKVITGARDGGAEGHAVAVQSDGKIVIAGQKGNDILVVRYHGDTSLAGRGSSGTGGDTGRTRNTGYTELIGEMRDWRNDPRLSSREHTDRWDRALLALGETVSDTTLTPMTASEAQGYADRGWTRWEDVAEALRALETASTPPDPQDLGQPVTSQQLVPPPLYASLIDSVNDWRNDPNWEVYKAHTNRWDRVLLALGEPVSDTTLTPMTASEAQDYVDRGWARWVDVVAALKASVTGTSGDDTLTGTDSGELLVGLGGDDTLSGLGGNDELRGGDGDDTLTGGDGNDRFVFFPDETGGNTITDFQPGDRIVLKGSGWESVSQIISNVVALLQQHYLYPLAGADLTVITDRPLRPEYFLAE